MNLKRMNQESADLIFEAAAYLASLIEWDAAMSVAHGGNGTPATQEASVQANLLRDHLYENEISLLIKEKYDQRPKSMFYHYNKEISIQERYPIYQEYN